MSRFFIDRPIFAIVVALLLVIIGAIAGFSLPIAQYPQISPPTVSVQTTYTGASGKVVNDTVAQVIEQQVNGTQGMDYMSSTSDDSGAYTLNVYFELGTNGDMDSVLVQNNVSIATSSLPSEVTAYGVTTKKSSQDMTLVGAVSSPNGSYDRNFIKNYLDIYLIDQIKRVHGVGDVNVFATNYTMRVWLNPDKIAELGITISDVVNAIRDQNVQAPGGTVGMMPAPDTQERQYTGIVQGRQLRPGIERAELRRLGDVDHAGAGHMLIGLVAEEGLHIPREGLSHELPLRVGQGDHLVAAVFDGPGLVDADVSGRGADHGLVASQQAGDRDQIRLGAAGQKLDLQVIPAAGGADLSLGRLGVGVGAVALQGHEVPFGKALQELRMRTLGIVGCE